MPDTSSAGTPLAVASRGYVASSLAEGSGYLYSALDAFYADPSLVRGARTISTGPGLSGGGDLSADRVLSVDDTVVRTATLSISGFVNDAATPGKAVVLLFPSSGSGAHNAMGRIMSQRSSGYRDALIADFAYSSRSSDPANPDLILKQYRGAQGTRNRWRFATCDYAGTNWVCLYYDGARYSVSTCWVTVETTYSGANFLLPLDTSSVSSLQVLTSGFGDEIFG